MNVAVRYYSKLGNTKKLAEAIAETTGCKAEPIPSPITEKVDILFLGASVYAYGISKAMKEYIHSFNKDLIGKVVVFSTSALVERAYPQIKEELTKVGIVVEEDNFYCRGQFLHLHKGRPNEADLQAVRTFAKAKAK